MKRNMIRRRNAALLWAAMGALAICAGSRPALAQYPVGQDGHANDANNRVGSSGYNRANPRGTGVTANDIATRNVTRGLEFRGPIGERDPRAFTGPVGGESTDVFIRQSAPAPSGYAVPQPFFGETRFTAPPSGSVPLGFSGGYVGTTLNSPSSLSSAFNTAPYTVGLQSRATNPDVLLLNEQINSPDYINALTNFNQTGTFVPVQQFGLGLRTGMLGTENILAPQPIDRFGPDEPTILRMRQEMRDSAVFDPNRPNVPQQPATPGTPTPAQPQSLNQPLNQPINPPFDAPVNPAVTAQVSGPALRNQLSSTGTIAPEMLARPTLVAPEMQSSLLDTLQRRVDQSGQMGKAMADARQARPQQPNAPQNPTVAPGTEQGPVQVSSLATGIRAKGLREVLASAEDLMREGKFDQAVQKYNLAQRVAPNNPLTVLGRAHAELAGGYYGRAEQDLRLVLRNDPQLLMAQFDLPALLPKDRLDFIRKDLHELTRSDPKAERPWLLLAYIDYNTRQALEAEKDLAEADKRTVRGDWVIRLMRQYWALPSSTRGNAPAPVTPRTLPPATPTPITPAPAPRPPTPAPPSPAPDLNK